MSAEPIAQTFPTVYVRGLENENERLKEWIRSRNEHRVRALRAERYVERLEDAIGFMCTEMPVGWEEMAVAEGRHDVVGVVQWAVNREGNYAPQSDGPVS